MFFKLFIIKLFHVRYFPFTELREWSKVQNKTQKSKCLAGGLVLPPFLFENCTAVSDKTSYQILLRIFGHPVAINHN